MRQRFLFTFIFAFIALNLSAQKWDWAIGTLKEAHYIDIALNQKGESITLFKDNDRTYHIEVHDSNGAFIREREFHYRDVYENAAYEIETDGAGIIYLLSRQTVADSKVKQQQKFMFDRHFYLAEQEELPEDEEEPSGNYIVLETFSPELKLLNTLYVLKIGDNGYSIDVCDMAVDAAGNVWFCGASGDEEYYFKEELIKPGTGGGAFVVSVPHDELKPGWIKVFVQAGSCCSYGIESYNIAVNKDGTCVITGAFSSDLELSDGTTFRYVKSGQLDGEMFMIAMDVNGIIKWSKRLGTPSLDKDVVALSNGNFVCAGYFTDAAKIGNQTLESGKTTGFFLMKIDANNGKYGQVYINDTSSIEQLYAGPKNDLYCTFQRGNSGTIFHVYHFNQKLVPDRLTQLHGWDPLVAIRDGVFVCAGTYGWNCSFGDQKPNRLYIGGASSDYGSFLAHCTLSEK